MRGVGKGCSDFARAILLQAHALLIQPLFSIYPGLKNNTAHRSWFDGLIPMKRHADLTVCFLRVSDVIIVACVRVVKNKVLLLEKIDYVVERPIE